MSLAASRLVAGREVRQRITRPAFLTFTALLVVGIIAAGVLFAVLDDKAPSKYTVAVTGNAAAFVQAVQAIGAAAGHEITISEFDDRAGAEAAVSDGDADVLVTDNGIVVWHQEVSYTLEPLLDQAWSVAGAVAAAEELGLDQAQIDSILSPAPLHEVILEPDETPAIGMFVGMASAVLLFVSVTMFGGYVLTGVVEEKSTGVVEVLLSHLRPHELMGGKVVGIGIVALIQFAAAVIAGLVALRISGVAVPSEVWVGLPSALAWFVGGFLLYSTLYALAGSFVSRVEDAQSAAAPITATFTAGYLVVFIFGYDPGGTVATVLSLLPPLAPLLMPLRMATGAATTVEVVVAAVLLIASIWGMLRLAGRVYSRTLLHRGSRLTWRQGLAATD